MLPTFVDCYRLGRDPGCCERGLCGQIGVLTVARVAVVALGHEEDDVDAALRCIDDRVLIPGSVRLLE
jgi:hypothetical protein